MPTGLTVTPVSATELQVTWDDVEFEHGYDLEVGPTGGTYAPVDGSPFGEDETSVLDTGLSEAPSTATWCRPSNFWRWIGILVRGLRCTRGAGQLDGVHRSPVVGW